MVEDLKKDFIRAADRLQTEHGYSTEQLLELIPRSISIPATVFSKEISPLRALVSYLKNEREMELKQISEKIHRSYRAVWGAHKDIPIEPEKTSYYIPLSAFNSRQSVLETVVSFLREVYGLRFSRISKLLNRSSSTVWTAYRRSKQK